MKLKGILLEQISKLLVQLTSGQNMDAQAFIKDTATRKQLETMLRNLQHLIEGAQLSELDVLPVVELTTSHGVTGIREAGFFIVNAILMAD
jgi:hypothetical protein